MPYNCLWRNISTTILIPKDVQAGKLTEQAYADGTQYVAVGSGFTVGDHVKILIAEHPADGGMPRLTERDIEIAAVYSGDTETSRIANLLQSRCGRGCLLLSDTVLQAGDSELQYSYVWIKRLSDADDAIENQRIEDKLLHIYADCDEKLRFTNYATLDEQQKQLTAEYLAPYAFLCGLLLLLILLSMLFGAVTRSNCAIKC